MGLFYVFYSIVSIIKVPISINHRDEKKLLRCFFIFLLSFSAETQEINEIVKRLSRNTLPVIHVNKANFLNHHLNHNVSELFNRYTSREKIRLRGRDLHENFSSVVHLEGSTDPEVAGLYTATIFIGTPPKKFTVQIDSGSNLLWVSCQTHSSNIRTTNAPFNYHNSSTNEIIMCNSEFCPNFGVQDNAALGCANTPSPMYCHYLLRYADDSSSFGIEMFDRFHLHSNGISARIKFGCATNQTGNLLTGTNVVDGVMGLAMGPSSIISQLSSQHFIPNAFSHCLSAEGGGLFVFGKIEMKDSSKTRLLKTPHTQYYVRLARIDVEFDSRVNATVQHSLVSENTPGTLVDSGTTLTFLIDPVYSKLREHLENLIDLPQLPLESTQGRLCYDFSFNNFFPFSNDRSWEDVRNLFPNLVLNFDDGGLMKIYPENYILLLTTNLGGKVACLGWENSNSIEANYSIIGDIVLQDHLMQFDIENMQLSWSSINCSNLTNSIKVQPFELLTSNNSRNLQIQAREDFISESRGVSRFDSLICLKGLLIILLFLHVTKMLYFPL